MRNTKILIAIFAYLSCTAAFATEVKIKKYSEKPQTRISYGGPNYNDPTPNGPGDMPGDAEEGGMDLSSYGGQNYSKPKPKPQTPASGTVSPGTATQTPPVPKPAKPPKPPVVTLPNGTTVYKNITTKTHKDIK